MAHAVSLVMDCPDGSVLIELMARAPLDPASDLDVHLAECADCRRLAFALAAETATFPEERRERIGRFEVVSEVGAGAMGRVYRARDPALGREVAIKVGGARTALSSDGDERLRREGQALARLLHPNVVAVHETGCDDGESYIVMEYVEGVTLDRWGATGRPAAEVVGVLAGVARGLAAAHDAGLVHRDVKPSNILVTADGTAKIGDFGLARVDVDRAAHREVVLPVEIMLRLSLTGSIIGTPAYMAPEQLLGGVATERSDQFGFCVTLFEALTGERPFTGRTTAELVAAIERGPASPAFERLPGRLRAVLSRGLQPDPARRYPSMSALASVLAPRAARTRWLAVAGAAWLALAGAMLLGSDEPASHCSDPDARIGRIFGAPRRALIIARFAEQDVRAVNEARGATDLLAAFGAHWQATEAASCRASSGRPSPLRDRQRACLERRLARADDLAVLLTQPGSGASLFEAVRAVESLGDPGSCLRVTASAGDPDPPSAALAPIAAAFERQVDRLVNLVHSRRTAEARDIAGLTAAVRALGIASLTSRVLIAQAEIDAMHDRFGDIERLLNEAAREAARAHEDALVAEAWTTRVFMLRMNLGRGEDARRWLAVADAAILRAGDPPELRARLYLVTGMLDADAGAFTDARRSIAAGIALLKGLQPLPPHALAYAEHLLGLALSRAGVVADARAAFERSLALLHGVHVELHPDMIATLLGLGVLLAPRDPRQAIEVLAKARQLTEQLLGPGHHAVGRAIDTEGNARFALGEYALAEALFRQAYELKRARMPSQHASLGYSLCNIANAERAQGGHASALRHGRECLDILRATIGPRDAMLARAHGGIAGALSGLGDRSGAIAEYQAALAIFEAGEDRGGQEAAVARVELADLLSNAGDAAAACAQLARAFPALREHREYDLRARAGLVACDAQHRRVDRAQLDALEAAVAAERQLSAEAIGFTAYGRARAWAALGDHGRARALAQTARAAFARAGITQRSDVPMRALLAIR